MKRFLSLAVAFVIAFSCFAFSAAAEETAQLEKISVSRMPDKISYNINEEADFSGLIIALHFSNGSQSTVRGSECKIEGFSSEEEGVKTITVSYTYGTVEKSCSFIIMVTNPYTVCPDGTVKITAPTLTLGNNETVVLTADTTNISEGTIAWEVYGTGYTADIDPEGETCSITCTAEGSVTVKAIAVDKENFPIYNADGDIVSDTVTITMEFSFFTRIIDFFSTLFNFLFSLFL